GRITVHLCLKDLRKSQCSSFHLTCCACAEGWHDLPPPVPRPQLLPTAVWGVGINYTPLPRRVCCELSLAGRDPGNDGGKQRPRLIRLQNPAAGVVKKSKSLSTVCELGLEPLLYYSNHS
ncbi:unnamed protein product, partial [Ectocarpus sp. 13 AM-2016]